MPADDAKVVWILGAGFSRFLGAPLLENLLTPASADRVATVYGPRMKMHLELGASGVRRVPLLYAAGKDAEWSNPEEFLERFDLALEQPSAEAILRAWSMSATARGLHGLVNRVSVADHRLDIARVLAAECCLFLKDADPALERWAPYVAWATALRPSDTIISFNYDRVLETLAPHGNIGVALPGEVEDGTLRPIALKMHGSVDWLLDNGSMRRADGTGLDEPNEAALFCPAEQIAIATPGPQKYRLTKGADSNGPAGALEPIWRRARTELLSADAVVIVGYRLPPTDAYSKQWLIERLGERVRYFHQDHALAARTLPVHTVLGPDLKHPHAMRLQGLLKAIDPWIDHVPWAMGAEDFLGLVGRDAIWK